MNYQKAFDDYIKLFILIVESVGQRSGNKKYQEVEKIIKRDRSRMEEFIEKDPPFAMAIGVLIISLLTEIHGLGSLSGYSNAGKVNTMVDDFYIHYLKDATNKFLLDLGEEPLEKPSDIARAAIIAI